MAENSILKNLANIIEKQLWQGSDKLQVVT